EEIFKNELGLDYAYLKKIIQMQIRVPQQDKKRYLEVFETSISNILTKLGESHQNISNIHSDLIKFIANNTDDIRDFKRFINSTLSFSYNIISFLNKRDLLTLEYIRLNNITLYETIYRNPIYFISHDKELNMLENMQTFVNSKTLDQEIKVFYD